MSEEELNNVVCQCTSDYEILNSAYDYIEKLENENKELKDKIKYYENPINYFKYSSKNVVDENKQLKEQFNMLYKGKKLKLLSIEKCKNKYCFNYKLERGNSDD